MAVAIVAPNGAPVAAIGISSPDSTDMLNPESPLAAKLARSARAVGKMLP